MTKESGQGACPPLCCLRTRRSGIDQSMTYAPLWLPRGTRSTGRRPSCLARRAMAPGRSSPRSAGRRPRRARTAPPTPPWTSGSRGAPVDEFGITSTPIRWLRSMQHWPVCSRRKKLRIPPSQIDLSYSDLKADIGQCCTETSNPGFATSPRPRLRHLPSCP